MNEMVLALAINGLVWGLIIALIALGLSVIFGLLDVINVAHGDFFMLGSVFAFALTASTGSFWIALALTPLIGFALGFALERLVIRPTISHASLTIVTTFGLSMLLQEAVRATYGAQPRRMPAPIEGTVPLFGIDYDVYRVAAAGFAAVMAHERVTAAIRPASSYAGVARRVDELLEAVGLSRLKTRLAGAFSYGDIALLEIALALANLRQPKTLRF